MPYYLIYQDSSIDEGSRTIIVGPFKNGASREAIKQAHSKNVGGCWSVGVFEWCCLGEIDGEVRGFDISSPLELLDRFTRRDQGDKETDMLHQWVEAIHALGFPLPCEGWLV